MDAIAERRLELRIKNDTFEVVVALARPEQVTPDEWKCRYEVGFGDAVTTREVHGGDSLQALQLAMASLDFELELGARDRSGALYHLNERFNSILENSGMQRKTSRALPPELINAIQDRYRYLTNFQSENIDDPIDPLTYVDSNGDHLLHIAADAGDLATVTALLDAGIDVNLLGDMDCSALHYAVRKQRSEVVTLLKSRGAITTLLDRFGRQADQL